MHGRLGPGKSPGGPDFDRFWDGLGSILGGFASHLEGLGGPMAALGLPVPAGRGQGGARSAQDRLRVGSGADFDPNLGPISPQKW